MKQRLVFYWLLAALCAAHACRSVAAQSQDQPNIIVGLAPQQHTGGLDAAGQGFLKELGPQSVRLAYEHGDHDFGISWAAQNGMGVLLMLGYGKECDATTESGRQCYADRSARLAEKYGDKVKYFEVWNEWNGGFGLGKLGWNKPAANDAAMYTDLLRKTYKAIKAVRPSAIVVGGSIAGANEAFLKGMLDAGAGDCMDMLAIHLYVYRQGWPGHVAIDAPGSVGAERFIQAATASENLVKQKTGKSMQILVTEAGFHGTDEKLGAEYLTELFKKANTAPFLEGIWWYQLRDANKGTFGLLRNDNTKKPAFAAFQAVVKGTTAPPGASSAAVDAAFPLHLDPTNRFLVDANNRPFFIHGDSPWSAMAQLHLAGESGATSTNTWDYYLANRQAKGFNAVIVNAIENEFCTTPPKNVLGELPFNAGATWWSNAFNTAQINEAYWTRVDSFVAKAKAKGMAVFMNPAYYGSGPAQGWSAELAAAHKEGWGNAFGQWLGKRYNVPAYNNLVWILAGDHEIPAGDARTCQLALLAGLETAAPEMLKTAHFKRIKLSLDDADYRPYMDLDAVYVNTTNGADQGQKAYNRGASHRPSFLWESYYEDDRLFDETPADLRRFAYTAALTGSTGHFYGQGSARPSSGIWPFGPDWADKLDLPGTLDMAHVRSALVAGNRNWWQLVPKFGSEIIAAGNEALSPQSKTFISSARRSDGKLVMIYVPETSSETRTFTVNMENLSGTPVNHRWFNPNTGAYSTAATTCNDNCPASKVFTTPGDNGNGKDWLLILDVGTPTN